MVADSEKIVLLIGYRKLLTLAQGVCTLKPVTRESRLKKVFNWFLVLMQLIVAGILISIGFSREHYESISQSIMPDALYLFDSVFINMVVSEPFSYVMFAFLAVLLFKEVFMKSLKVRLLCNIAVLGALVLFLVPVFAVIFSPIPS